MVNPGSPSRHDPRAICNAYFVLAKKWLTFALLCKLLIFVVGTITVFVPSLGGYIPPLLITLFAIIAELFSWRSDVYKGSAEALLRKLDARDSLGWAISGAEMSDLGIRSPKKLSKLVSAAALNQEYFASQEGVGAKRTLENIQESAWWSKHLSERMGQYYLLLTVGLIIGLVLVLAASVETVRNYTLLVGIGRVVTASLMLVFSLGLFRSVLGYYSFAGKAARIEERIEHLLGNVSITEIDAIKVMHEYQLARSSAPLIPSWLWEQMKDDLNEMWHQYRQPHANQP
ncbi:hypothetical protein ACN4EK_24130 [Pantanalinema rosaneae CENA516]|jgi:hypothetical protein|uniref:hypothetical protein n=1 Tax=Pantanalinema rosaneae TaxID=1620701 RepID=UPI003D6FA2F7